MSYPALRFSPQFSITQLITLAVCFQLIGIFTKLFARKGVFHRCVFESAFIGASFPLLVGAICNIVFAWFPTNERTQALAVGYMMIPLITALKYTFFTRNIESDTSAQIAHGITLFEIFEANLFTLLGVLAIFIMKDKPKNPPSFLATQS